MSMSTMQAAVCLLFNDAAELSYKEVQVCTLLREHRHEHEHSAGSGVPAVQQLLLFRTELQGGAVWSQVEPEQLRHASYAVHYALQQFVAWVAHFDETMKLERDALSHALLYSGLDCGRLDRKPCPLLLPWQQPTERTNMQYDDLERTNMQDDDLVRLLHSLCCTKFKLLNKEPEGKTINKNDKFRCGTGREGPWSLLPV
eukprot:1160284-Pelagomonas_calceolata.AAC.10